MCTHRMGEKMEERGRAFLQRCNTVDSVYSFGGQCLIYKKLPKCASCMSLCVCQPNAREAPENIAQCRPSLARCSKAGGVQSALSGRMMQASVVTGWVEIAITISLSLLKSPTCP